MIPSPAKMGELVKVKEMNTFVYVWDFEGTIVRFRLIQMIHRRIDHRRQGREFFRAQEMSQQVR